METILSGLWARELVAFLPGLRYNTTTEMEFLARFPQVCHGLADSGAKVL
jgi:hypothetical protein